MTDKITTEHPSKGGLSLAPSGLLGIASAIDEVDEWRIACNWKSTDHEWDSVLKVVIALARDSKRLTHENSVLCDFINRELKMTGNDPRLLELEKRMAAMPNADLRQDADSAASQPKETTNEK